MRLDGKHVAGEAQRVGGAHEHRVSLQANRFELRTWPAR
jgi:hypothetical protein